MAENQKEEKTLEEAFSELDVLADTSRQKYSGRFYRTITSLHEL